MRMASCSRVWDVGGLWIPYRFFLVLLSKIKTAFEWLTVLVRQICWVHITVTQTHSALVQLHHRKFLHMHTPSIEPQTLRSREQWQYHWTMRKVGGLGCPGDVCSTVGSRSFTLVQEQGFPWSLGSGKASSCQCAPFSFLALFCFRHVVIKSQTRAQTNVMETIDISTADTKVILAVYLSW